MSEQQTTEKDYMLAEAVRLLEYALSLRMYGDGKDETQADWDAKCERLLRSLSPVRRAHNHQPYRPVCNERVVFGRVRGACLNDDGSDR